MSIVDCFASRDLYLHDACDVAFLSEPHPGTLLIFDVTSLRGFRRIVIDFVTSQALKSSHFYLYPPVTSASLIPVIKKEQQNRKIDKGKKPKVLIIDQKPKQHCNVTTTFLDQWSIVSLMMGSRFFRSKYHKGVDPGKGFEVTKRHQSMDSIIRLVMSCFSVHVTFGI